MLAVAVVVALLPFAALVPSAARDRCDGRLGRGGSSTSISISRHDDETRRFAYFASTAERCVEAEVRGQVEFSADEQRVTRMGPGAVATFRERTAERDRRVRWVAAADGGARAEVTLDGRPAGDDGATQAWVGAILQEVLRESGVDAPARVARLRGEGGAAAVLSMIDGLRSGGARRAHYRALLAAPDLPADDAERAVRHATRTLSTSSGDLRSVLEEVPERARQSPGVRDALGDGVQAIASDGDRRSLLVRYIATPDRAMVLTSLEGVRTMRSDGDKRAVLTAGAESALAPDDAPLRAAWFDAARTIRSDGDLAAVLVRAAGHAEQAPGVTPAILDAVAQLRSDGDAARVLVTLAHARLVKTPELRERYVAAARRLSDGDQRRAIAALPGDRPTSY